MAANRLIDPAYLRFQYGDDEKLRTRVETHERYSESTVNFRDWVLGHVAAAAGQSLLDVGSGPGYYHDRLSGAEVVAIDMSLGMLEKVRVPRAQADAQALPFRDRTFDRVMANHVLFHVPDQTRALREMKRVLRRGGRIVMATNSRASMRPLFEMQAAVTAEIGLPTEGSVGLRFALEDLGLVRSVFPSARAEIFDDAFRFTEVEPVLRYVASQSIGYAGPDIRAEFLRRLGGRVQAVIDRDGVFRVPKRAGCFVADV